MTPDENVEVAFTVSPAVRRIRFHTPDLLDFNRDWIFIFFSSSVQFTPQTKASLEATALDYLWLDPGSTIECAVAWDPSLYAVLAPRHHTVAYISAGQGTAHDVEIDIFDGYTLPDDIAMAAGDLRLRLHNRTAQKLVVGLMRGLDLAFSSGDTANGPYTLRPYLTGKLLLTSQTFRELFRTESIPSESGLELKSLTILFTDLKGSTALYDQVGDFNAYSVVREHFKLLRNIVVAHRGAIVKTMGDAIMATFAEPLPALQAALAMQQEISTLNADGQALALKVGLHTGPCIAINADERLDYFGQTINIASRVQSAAAAGEIVCTDIIYHTPGAPDLIEAANLTAGPEQITLRGVGEPTLIYRLQPGVTP